MNPANNQFVNAVVSKSHTGASPEAVVYAIQDIGEVSNHSNFAMGLANRCGAAASAILDAMESPQGLAALNEVRTELGLPQL